MPKKRPAAGVLAVALAGVLAGVLCLVTTACADSTGTTGATGRRGRRSRCRQRKPLSAQKEREERAGRTRAQARRSPPSRVRLCRPRQSPPIRRGTAQ
ncbi:hypothetical protein [Streptomyces europaeiscabiei]|uniref:hypothetical protein n=1 Tax=Streptomyces europaeiscabiei TaxID=146819 RepID=UPI0029AD9BFF|nr:hypothetical protein [Streptomyces europaeiscabiei]MDX3615887.1 hypothetical protein [Streptomyces europaeiscabiei]WUD37309.1 hypothetical protein OG858_41810 [Streptomyces europaeiscabiei]